MAITCERGALSAHFEGFTDPIGYYREQLAPLDEKTRERFFGGTMLDVYARMGDPIR